MSRLRTLIRENASTAWMLVGLCFIYSAFVAGHSMSDRGQDNNKLDKPHSEFSRQALQEKELRFMDNLKKDPNVFKAVVFCVLSVLTLGLCIDFFLIGKLSRGEDWISHGYSLNSIGWGIREVVQCFALLFFIEAVLMAGEEIAGYRGDVVLMANSFVRDLIVAFMILSLVRKKFGHNLSDLGLTLGHWAKDIRTGLLGYVAILPPLCFVLVLTAVVAKMFSYEPEPQAVVQIFLKNTPGRTLLFFTIFVAVVGPMFEEIFFRGFLYKAFREKFGVKTAAIISAGLFSAIHLNLVAFVPIFFLGLFLVYLYEKSGTLIPSMTAHMTHNLLMVCFTFGFKSLSA